MQLPTNGRPRGRRALKIVGGTVAVLLGLFVVLALLGSRDHDARVAVVEHLLERARAGDPNGAHALTTESFQSIHTSEQLASLLEQKLPAGCTVEDWTLADRGPDGAPALRASARCEDGREADARFTFADGPEGYLIQSIEDPLPASEPVDTARSADPPGSAVDDAEDDDEDEGEYRWGFSWTTATLKNTRLALNASPKAPPMTEFSRDVKEIFCLADLAYAPSGTKITATWLYHDAPDEADEPVEVVSTDVFAEDSTTTLHFTLFREDENLFPAGRYSVRLNVNDKVQTSIDFVMRDPTVDELLTRAERDDTEAQFALFAYHELGKAPALDRDDAIEWLRRAAASGHAVAQYDLAQLYYQGRGVDRDHATAFTWLERAAEQEHPGAEYDLGVSYREGRGVEPSLTEAVVWTRKAAEHGDADGQFNMGVHYNTGAGVPEDPSAAARWFRQCADQGAAQCQSALASLYERGRGVERDIQEALQLYRAAAEAGDESAREAVARLGSGRR